MRNPFYTWYYLGHCIVRCGAFFVTQHAGQTIKATTRAGMCKTLERLTGQTDPFDVALFHVERARIELETARDVDTSTEEYNQTIILLKKAAAQIVKTHYTEYERNQGIV